MLQRFSTTLVALSLVASAGQAAPVNGDQGATSANQAVANNQDAMAVNHGGFALTVIGDKGTTLVNRGTGFSPVTGTTELKPGDRFLVRNGAGARITYPDGCNVPVRGVATVDPLSPCNFMAADLPSRKAPPGRTADCGGGSFPILAVGGAGLGRRWHWRGYRAHEPPQQQLQLPPFPSLPPGFPGLRSDILYSEGALDMSAPSERFAVRRLVAQLGYLSEAALWESLSEASNPSTGQSR